MEKLLTEIANICHENNGAEMYGKLLELMKGKVTAFANWYKALVPSDIEVLDSLWQLHANYPIISFPDFLFDHFIENVYGK